MVLVAASCPSKVHCAAIIALQNGLFSRLGGGVTHSHTPLSFVPKNNARLKLNSGLAFCVLHASLRLHILHIHFIYILKLNSGLAFCVLHASLRLHYFIYISYTFSSLIQA